MQVEHASFSSSSVGAPVSSSAGGAQQDNIHVAIRVRPLNTREINSGQGQAWHISERSLTPFNAQTGRPIQQSTYSFDRVFGMRATNADIYHSLAKPLILSCMDGINGTIFAYGQTSSGKTFTMKGSDDGKEPGLVPLSVGTIFDFIEDSPHREFLIRVSYLEIYNESIKDLLNPEKENLKIHENVDKGVFVGDLTEEIIVNQQQIMGLMEKGEANRSIGCTNMNEHSSRSHTVFRLVIESREISRDGEENESPARNSNGTSSGSHRNSYGGDDIAVKVSILNLVDLAGSERARQTGAEGKRLKEGGHINKSLLTLGTVIGKLSESKESSHIPFRDSKITRILQPSLGGNARTAVICTVTPASSSVEESQSTLKFASRASKVRNKPQVNEIMSDQALLKKYRIELAELKKELKSVKCKGETDNILQLENENQKVKEEKELILDRLKAKEKIEKEQQEKLNKLKELIIVSSSKGTADKNIGKEKKRPSRRETWCPGAASGSSIVSFSEMRRNVSSSLSANSSTAENLIGNPISSEANANVITKRKRRVSGSLGKTNRRSMLMKDPGLSILCEDEEEAKNVCGEEHREQSSASDPEICKQRLQKEAVELQNKLQNSVKEKLRLENVNKEKDKLIEGLKKEVHELTFQVAQCKPLPEDACGHGKEMALLKENQEFLNTELEIAQNALLKKNEEAVCKEQITKLQGELELFQTQVKELEDKNEELSRQLDNGNSRQRREDTVYELNCELEALRHEYEEYQNDAKGLQDEFVRDFSRLEEDCEKYQLENEKMVGNITSLEGMCSALENDVLERNDKLAQLLEELEAKEAECDKLVSSKQKMEVVLSSNIDRANSKDKQLEEATCLIESLKTQHEEEILELKGKLEKMEELEVSLNKAQWDLEMNSTGVAEKEQECKVLEARLAELDKEYQSATERLRKDIAVKESIIKSLEESSKTDTENKDAICVEKEMLEEKLQTVENALSELGKEYKDKCNFMESLQRDFENQKQEFDSVVARLKAQESETEKLRSCVKQKEAEQSNLAQERHDSAKKWEEKLERLQNLVNEKTALIRSLNAVTVTSSTPVKTLCSTQQGENDFSPVNSSFDALVERSFPKLAKTREFEVETSFDTLVDSLHSEFGSKNESFDLLVEDCFKDEIGGVQEELNILREENESLRGQMELSKKRIDALETERQIALEKQAHLKSKLESVQSNEHFYSQLEKELAVAQDEVKTKTLVFDEKMQEAENERLELAATVENLKSQLKTHLEEMAIRTQESQDLKSTLDAERDKKVKVQNLFAESEAQVHELEIEMENWKSKVSEHESKVGQLTVQLEAIESSNGQLIGENKTLEKELNQLKNEVGVRTPSDDIIEELKEQLKSMKQKNAVVKINLDVAEGELKDVRDRSEMMENDIKQLRAAKKEMETKIMDNDDKTRLLENGVKELELCKVEMEKKLMGNDECTRLLMGEIQQLEAYKDDIESKLNEQNEATQMMEKHTAELDIECMQLQTAKEQLTESMIRLQNEAEEERKAYLALEEEHGQLNILYDAARSSYVELQGENEALKTKLDSACNSENMSNHLAKELDDKIVSLTEHLNYAQETSAQYEKEISELNGHISVLNNGVKQSEERIIEMESILLKYEEEKNGVAIALEDKEAECERKLEEMEIKFLNESKQVLQDTERSFASKESALNETIQSLKDEIRTQVKIKEQQLSELFKIKASQYEETIQESEIEVLSLRRQLEEATSQCDQTQKVEEKVSSLQKELGELHDRYEAVEENLRQSNALNEKARLSLSSMEKENSHLTETSEYMKLQLKEFEETNEILTGELSDKLSLISSLEEDVVNLKAENERSKSPSAIMFEEFQKEREDLNASILSHQAEVKSLSGKCSELEQCSSSLKEQVKTLEEALDKARSELNAKEDAPPRTPKKRVYRSDVTIPSTPILSTPAGKESVNAKLIRELKGNMNKLNSELEVMKGEKRTLSFMKESEGVKYRSLTAKVLQLERENERLNLALSQSSQSGMGGDNTKRTEPSLVIGADDDEYDDPKVQTEKRKEELITEDKENATRSINAELDSLSADSKMMPPPKLPSLSQAQQGSKPRQANSKQLGRGMRGGVGFSKKIGTIKDASEKNPEECTQQ
eukprot:Nk52_evm12s2635 gene=Nk52_evmTU12s2635